MAVSNRGPYLVGDLVEVTTESTQWNDYSNEQHLVTVQAATVLVLAYDGYVPSSPANGDGRGEIRGRVTYKVLVLSVTLRPGEDLWPILWTVGLAARKIYPGAKGTLAVEDDPKRWSKCRTRLLQRT